MDCTVIILAGGQGVRLGRLGQLTSKALLVAYDRPLLIRHLDHLVEADFRDIVISTNPAHYPAIHALVNSYRPDGTAHIEVVENPAHRIGPIEALYAVFKRTETRRCLIVLVDLFVRGNGFLPFAEQVAGDDDYTAVGPVINARERWRGGYVRCRESRIEAFVERTEAEAGDTLPSAGTSLFSTQPTRVALEAFLATAEAGASVSDFYNFRCHEGHVIHALMGPDFVNINTPDHLLLATLYAAMEAHAEQAPVYESLASAASTLRNQFTQAT